MCAAEKFEAKKCRLAICKPEDLVYRAGPTEEHFLAFNTPEDRLAGFLRLSLPQPGSPSSGLPDLDGAAIIREVHVYGQSLPVGTEARGAAQHAGLGARLIRKAERIARVSGFKRLAVIAAVGTRRYYLKRGFKPGDRYLVKDLRFKHVLGSLSKGSQQEITPVAKWLSLFWIFIKINLLTTSGPASVGLLYKEAVGHLMTESQFVEAVGFSSVLPGSDALAAGHVCRFCRRGVPRCNCRPVGLDITANSPYVGCR